MPIKLQSKWFTNKHAKSAPAKVSARWLREDEPRPALRDAEHLARPMRRLHRLFRLCATRPLRLDADMRGFSPSADSFWLVAFITLVAAVAGIGIFGEKFEMRRNRTWMDIHSHSQRFGHGRRVSHNNLRSRGWTDGKMLWRTFWSRPYIRSNNPAKMER